MKLHTILLLVIISPAFSSILYTQPEMITFSRTISDAGQSRGVTVEEIRGGGYILTGVTSDGEYGSDDIFLIKTNPFGDTIWKKTYGTEGNDYGWAVRQTEDDGYILVGYTDGMGNGSMDVYLLKTDTNGIIEWTRTFGGSREEYGWDVRITKDGGYIIAGQTESMGNGEIDACLIKVDDKGNEEWFRTYGGEKTDRIFSVQETHDDGFIGAGITYSYESSSDNDRDGYFIKVDAAGNQEWYKTIGEEHYDVIHDVEVTKDGGFFFAGYGESYATSGYRDAYLLKTDNHGNTKWMQVVGAPGEERGLKGIQSQDGGYVVVGFTSETRDVYLIKADSVGNIEWTRNIGSKESVEFGYTVKASSDGGYIITGHTESMTGKRSIILIKTDKEGMIDSMD